MSKESLTRIWLIVKVPLPWRSRYKRSHPLTEGEVDLEHVYGSSALHELEERVEELLRLHQFRQGDMEGGGGGGGVPRASECSQQGDIF